MSEFKDMLKYFRMREHLSQSELAERLGVSTSRIAMYEAGKREPDFETEERIADFFNTDLNTLRGRDIENFTLYGKLRQAIELFESLSDIGQDMAIANMELVKKVHPRTFEEDALLNAAHERTDIYASSEDKLHDNDIMNDDNF